MKVKIVWTLTFPCGKRIIFEEKTRKCYILMTQDQWYNCLNEPFGIRNVYKYKRMKMSFETYKKRYLQ